MKNNIIANIIGGLVSGLSGILFVPVYIKYLGIEAWSLVGFMAILQGWFTLFDLGFTPTLSREMARFKAGKHSNDSICNILYSLEIICFGISIFLIILVWVLSPILSNYCFQKGSISTNTISQVICIIGILLGARILEQIYRGSLQGLQCQVWLNLATSISSVLKWGGAVFVLKYVSCTIIAFFIWQIIPSLAFIFFLRRKLKETLPLSNKIMKLDFEIISTISGFIGGTALIALMAVLLTQVDRIILLKISSVSDFGYYTFAASLAGSIAFLIMPFFNVISPKIAELVAKGDDLLVGEKYQKYSQVLAFIITPVAIIMVFFPKELIHTWTSNLNLTNNICLYLPILALARLMNGYMHVPYATQLGYGWTGFTITANTISLILIIPALLFTIPKYGTIAAAWITLVLNLVYMVVGIYLMHNVLLKKERLKWYVTSVIYPISICSTICFLSKKIILFPDSRFYCIFILIAIIAILYFSLLICMPTPRKLFSDHFGYCSKIRF